MNKVFVYLIVAFLLLTPVLATRAFVDDMSGRDRYSLVDLVDVNASRFCIPGTIVPCISDWADIGGGSGNLSWNQDYADTLYYSINNPFGFLNESSADNTYARLDGIDASNITSGVIASSRLSNNYPLITGVGTLLSGIWRGTVIEAAYLSNIFDQTLNMTSNVTFANVTATYYFGDGSQLSNLPTSDNSSWNESYADTLYYGLGNPNGYVASGTTNAWVIATDNITGFPTHLSNFTNDLSIVEDNTSWNESYADTLYYPLSNPFGYLNTSTGGNSSWNESYADTLYYAISNPYSFLNATSAGLLYRSLTASVNASYIINSPSATPAGNNFLVRWEGANATYRSFNPVLETYNANNITSGTLGYARLPSMTLSQLNTLLSDATLSESPNTEDVQDIVGGMVSGNTESGITVTYQDADGTLDFVVDSSALNITGVSSDYFQDGALSGYVFDYINATDNSTVYRPMLENLTGSCDGNKTGVMMFNYTSFVPYICNSTAWVSLI